MDKEVRPRPEGGHLFVSAHLDDAVLSCGAEIGRLVAAGHEVLVVTVFAGAAPANLPPLARALHQLWGLADTEVRRREDARACAVLGAGFEHLDFPDAVYRRDGEGRPSYLRLRALYGPGCPSDELVLRELAERLSEIAGRRPGVVLHGPAGVGGHVDHVLTSRALQELDRDLLLYEDLPYGCRQEPGPAAPGSVLLVRSSAADRSRKLAALEHYASQLPALWPEGGWARELDAHSAGLGGVGAYVERSWHRPAVEKDSPTTGQV